MVENEECPIDLRVQAQWDHGLDAYRPAISAATQGLTIQKAASTCMPTRIWTGRNPVNNNSRSATRQLEHALSHIFAARSDAACGEIFQCWNLRETGPQYR